ncbi:MAG: fluoride efflux transporter FluC [Acidimicrobiales bacterium]
MRPSNTLAPKQLATAVGVVALGGALGTLVRDLASRLEPAAASSSDWVAHVPWVLLAINVAGAYAATWLLRRPLRGHDPNDRWRLIVVTGFFGGLTSYSGLFVGVADVWHRCPGGGLVVAVGAVTSGVAAAGLGLAGHHRRHHP